MLIMDSLPPLYRIRQKLNQMVVCLNKEERGGQKSQQQQQHLVVLHRFLETQGR